MERSEFEQLALEHLDGVYRMSMQLTRNPERAEDLVQEVYVRAFRPSVIDRFVDQSREEVGADGQAKLRGGMRSWLMTITHNTFYTLARRETRAPSAVGEFYEEDSRELGPDEAPPAWDLASFDWEHVDERIVKAIDELREDYRGVLLMWGVEGLKYREIAERLEVPIGTVMSRLHRARKTLAEALGGEDGPARELGFGRVITDDELAAEGKAS